MTSQERVLWIGVVVVLALSFAGYVVAKNMHAGCPDICESTTTEVLVADQDIPANTKLNPLIDAGVFRPIEIPNDDLVGAAVTNTDQLRGMQTTAFIFRNEQIPLSRTGTYCKHPSPPPSPLLCIDTCC